MQSKAKFYLLSPLSFIAFALYSAVSFRLNKPVKTPHKLRSFLQILFVVACCQATWHAVALNAAALQQQLIARFGPARIELLQDWVHTVNAAKPLSEDAKLKRINDFINHRIVFDTDNNIWQQSDYWATPLETIGQGRGDCEDFAIIKYLSLRLAGLPDDKLRLIYVKAKLNTPAGPMQQAHMVLAYYRTPNAEPLILDNLNRAIHPASQRKDLIPVFSFNSKEIFAGISGKDKGTAGGIGRLSRWEDAWRRIVAEAYE